MRGEHRRGCGCGQEGDSCPRATTRVQLELPPQAMERLQRLKERTEAVSYAEVVRGALRLYEALAEAQDKGGEVLLKRQDGDTVPLKVFV